MGIKNEPSKSFAQKAINFYLNNYLESLFAGAFMKHEFSPIKPDIQLASELQSKKNLNQKIFFSNFIIF